MIRSRVLRAVHALRGASRIVDVVRRRLPRPHDAPRLDVESHDGIARGCRGMGIVVARRDVQQAAAGIDRRPRPDTDARRAERRRADARRAGAFRFVDEIRLPHDRPVANTDRRDAAAKRAARIFGIERARFLPRGGGNEGDAVLHRGRTRQPRRLVRLDSDLPCGRAGARIDRMDPTVLIAEDERGLCAVARHGHRRAHRTVGLIRPIETSGLRIERLNRAAGAADEHRSVDDRRRTERRHVAREPERPLQLQLAEVGGVEAGASSHADIAYWRNRDSSRSTMRVRPPTSILRFAGVQNALAGGCVSSAPVPRNVATASRSSRLIGEAMLIINPKSSVRRMRAGDICVSEARVGMRRVDLLVARRAVLGVDRRARRGRSLSVCARASDRNRERTRQYR